MRVFKTEVGWAVEDGGEIVADGLTNSQAWRLADKMIGDLVNKSQETSEWVMAKEARR